MKTSRKGSKKVKTGCLTCKIRKVKCDETKPSCIKCTSTGRSCDGYTAPQSEPSPYGMGKLNTLRGNVSEARALDFFLHVVGPALSGHFDDNFWVYIVPQLSHNMVPIRHALVAISSLYEQFQNTSRPLNAALRGLMSTSDETLALFMSILFTCIEFLQGNKQLAINHCRHGVLIFNEAGAPSAWARDYLLPMFSNLSIFPFFFGSNVSTFPPHLASFAYSVPASFSNIKEAQSSLDTLLSRWIRFIRSCDTYRLGALRQAPIPTTLRIEQYSIEKSMDEWYYPFLDLKVTSPPLTDSDLGFSVLEMRYLVSKIWVSRALERNECSYDIHMDDFRSIVDLASQVNSSTPQASDRPSRRKFTFNMGFLPPLYFVVMKCRSLKLRISALLYMKALAPNQESLWDTEIMCHVGRRVIETEHSVNFDDLGKQASSNWNLEMPPEDKRIKENMMGEPDIRYDENGLMIYRRKVSFIFTKAGGELDVINEWVEISQK